MIRNIIWDVDGTLFDTYPPIARAFKRAIEYLGKDVSIDRIEELSKISLNHCVSTISTEYKPETADIGREFNRYYLVEQRRIVGISLLRRSPGLKPNFRLSRV